MRVTTKGQVTIPLHVRQSLGITAKTNVVFVEENGRFYITKANVSDKTADKTVDFSHLRGIADTRMTTDDIMALTRQ